MWIEDSNIKRLFQYHVKSLILKTKVNKEKLNLIIQLIFLIIK